VPESERLGQLGLVLFWGCVVSIPWWAGTVRESRLKEVWQHDMPAVDAMAQTYTAVGRDSYCCCTTLALGARGVSI
jgi:hypothetical protein